MQRIVRGASAALAVVLGGTVSGCWLQPDFGPERHAFNPFETTLTAETIGQVEQAWSTPLAAGGEPLVDGGTVYVAGTVAEGSTGRGSAVFSAVDRSSGALSWEHRSGELFIPQGEVLSVGGDEVLTVRSSIADPSGLRSEIVAIDAATGAPAGTIRVDDTVIRGHALVAGNRLVYATSSLNPLGTTNRLVVVDRATLAPVWSSTVTGVIGGTEVGVVVANGMIYVSRGGSAIWAYALAGCGAATCDPAVRMGVPQPPGGLTSTGVEARAAAEEQLLVQRDWNDGTRMHHDLVALTVVGPDAGTVAWTLPLLELGDVAVAGDTVYVSGIGLDGTGHLFARRTDGTTWQGELAPGSGSASPDEVVVAGGLAHVAVGRDVQVFHADGCGAASCAPLATLDTAPATGDVVGMSVSGGTLFVSTAAPDPRLIAFAPAR